MIRCFTDRMHKLVTRGSRGRQVWCSFVLLLAFLSWKSWASQDGTELRLGHFPNLTHAQAVYARATGEFEKAIGVRIRWVAFNAGPSAIEALFSDAIDITFIGPNPAINGYIKSKGTKFVIIAGAASGGAGLVLRKDSGIQSDKDFNDKIITTPQIGNTQDVAARIWFAEKGYRLREKGGRLSLVALSNPDQLTMFQKRQIHGAWTVEPWVSRLEIEGGGVLFLDEKTLWPQGRYTTTQIVCSKEFLARNQTLVKTLLSAHIDVTRRIQSNPAEAGRILNAELKKETGKALKEEVIKNAMKRIEFTWDPIVPSLYQCAEAAHKVGFLRKKPNLEGIHDLRLLNEVLEEKKLPPLQENNRP
jgi:NitT/TauT family transport system substrate-binding protein